jgi:hypothetical protein
MTIDGLDITALVEAGYVPALLLLGTVFVLLKYPPRPSATVDGELLKEVRRLSQSVEALAGLVETQKDLTEKMQDISLIIARLEGRLSR